MRSKNKLGRSYINLFEEKTEKDAGNKISSKTPNNNEAIHPQIEEGRVRSSQLRGYYRSNRIPEQSDLINSLSSKSNHSPNSISTNQSPIANHSHEGKNSAPPDPLSHSDQDMDKESSRVGSVNPSPGSEISDNHETRRMERTRFCHYYSNFGKCEFERKTGSKCKYEHSENAPLCENGTKCSRNKCMFKHPHMAPLCENGTSCSRPKCMFKHPNLAARDNSFLARNALTRSPFMDHQIPNPWQLMAPWWLTTPGPFSMQNLWQSNQPNTN